MTQSSALQRLITEDAVGQLRRRKGEMARLGSENGELKLDWVEGIARLLADTTNLEAVEAEAQAIWEQGTRHIIWSGMGGSVITVHVLADLGFCDGQNGIAIYPLDSTDPAALNAIVRSIAAAKQLVLPPQNEQTLNMLLHDVMMIGVSMGMTSEEPITHLEWFTDLLQKAHLPLAEHLLVMTLPGSYLDQFAMKHAVPSRPLQLDRGTGTGGRMSAPTTRVFLLPAALYLLRHYNTPGTLRSVLQKAWSDYNLDLAAEYPAQHPFVQLAAALSDASQQDVCRLLLTLPVAWQALIPWIEQLMEESLGKGGKGVIVFEHQALNTQATQFHTDGTLFVQVTSDAEQAQQQAQETSFTLVQPSLASKEPRNRLAAVATSFLGWQLAMALYGYLHAIPFAGQPAVEDYKARARVLRTEGKPLDALPTERRISEGRLMLMLPQQTQQIQDAHSPSAVFAQQVRQATTQQSELAYLDLTINGDIPTSWLQSLALYQHIGNSILGVPVKLRRAPAAYHSTEQSEMDGSPHMLSLRLLTRDHESIIIGNYDDLFLQAQAVSTWQAMVEQGRNCFLLLINGTVDDAVAELEQFFTGVAQDDNHDGRPL